MFVSTPPDEVEVIDFDRDVRVERRRFVRSHQRQLPLRMTLNSTARTHSGPNQYGSLKRRVW
jgi:hypothetical protein